MKKIKLAVVGYGNRGQVYADYSLDEPTEVEVSAVIDPNEYKLKVAKDRYRLADGQVFTSYADFIASGVEADIVVNATMEQFHYQTAMEILRSKHHMLIEKPIVANEKELQDIRDAAKENGCMVFVCHVLRYSPFYKTIKTMIAEGKLGKITSMEMNEHVWIPHFLGSYVRGKWNSEQVCGSPVLLAKCCHDMDLICWLNGSKPERVSCFGHRCHFVPENKPEGATKYCIDCPSERECPYSALNLNYHHDMMPFLVWDPLNKPYNEITKEEKEAFLRKDDHGRCAYDLGGDVMDRQNLIVDFADGSLAAFTLSCGTCRPDRYVHIVGTKGEVEGKLEENKFIFRTYNKDTVSFREEIIDVTPQVVNKAKYGGHSGGDYGIMYDLVRYLNGERTSMSITLLEDSVASHLLVYAAEESRKSGRFVTL
ncbi:MAG: Gfo/Idh/MocA family oxidoreductase [Clostridia bacterium]|nr:Gfo/Idh/MocA family oxidoreductase [Clostridia bacterium]